MENDIKLLIENSKSENKERLIVYNPYNRLPISSIIKPNSSEIELAFDNAYNSRVIMKQIPAYKRADILYSVSNMILSNSYELAHLIATEGGKPMKDALVEVSRAANTVKFAGDESLRLNGEQFSMDRAQNTENHIAFTIKEPLGVVLAISAFNHPINLICHQISTAIAAGNPIIVKPSEKTPLSAYKITEYFLLAGLPPKAISLLPLNGDETYQIISDKRLSFVSFIGSSKVGWQIPKIISSGVSYSLEHGGTATAIVDSNCYLDLSVNSIVKGAFYHAGQVCVSTQNVFVHQSIYDDFVELLKMKTAQLVIGDPVSEKTDVGPIISTQKKIQIMDDIKDAIDFGANILLGGLELNNTCISPTILENTNYSMRIMKDEVFGPVVNINKFDDINEIVEKINKTPYSFQNAIYTNDINKALSYAKNIQSKSVIINDSTAFRVDWMPFGGELESGFGVGGVKYSIDDLVKDKLIIIKHII